MSRRVGIWGICDTGGVGAVLRIAFPQDRIIPLVEPSNVDDQAAWIETFPSQLDVLVTPYWRPLSARLLEIEHDGLPIVRYPPIIFRAFHPDLFYIYRKSGGALAQIGPPYNSGICVWCYLNGVPAERAAALFNSEVFALLGYFSEWGPSLANLQAQQEQCGLDFSTFYLSVKRHGAFMHSINHPKAVALVALGKQIALKLGAPREIVDEPIEIFDTLAHLGWPIYPEIGEYYGLRTTYRWPAEQPFESPPLGLEEFIARSYRAYAELAQEREDICFEGAERCEAVLRPLAGC